MCCGSKRCFHKFARIGIGADNIAKIAHLLFDQR